MANYKSYGGRKPTKAEENLSAGKMLLIYVVLVAVIVGGAFGVRHVLSKQDNDTVATGDKECSQVLDGSVFTTGDPLLDQRILWTIVNDESEGSEVAAELVQHVWEDKNFKFSGDAENLWSEAVTAVPEVEGSIEKPALSVTSDGVIIPYVDAPEAKDVNWTETPIDVSEPRTTFVMTSKAGEEQSPAVPTVLLSINGANVVPSPTLGIASEHVAVNMQEVCEQ